MTDLRTEFQENLSLLEELVQLCGRFLTTRENIVLLVHLSVKEFFTEGNSSKIIFSSFQQEDGKIACRSLDIMSNTLHENMCDVQKPGTLVAEAYKFCQSRFKHVGYACCYRVDHLTDARPFKFGRRSDILAGWPPPCL